MRARRYRNSVPVAPVGALSQCGCTPPRCVRTTRLAPGNLRNRGAKRIECRAPVTGGMKVSTKAGPARLLLFERVDDLPQSRLADCDDDREVVSSVVFAWPPRSDLDDPCRPASLRPACCASLADAQMPRAAYHRSWHAVCLVLPIERRANHHEQYRNDVP